MDHIKCDDFIVLINTCPIRDTEIMAFACDQHVVVTVIAHFAGFVRATCRNGASHGQCVTLTFLAAKTAAHSAHFDTYVVKLHPKGFGNFMLHLCRMLGR